ncbi:MAG TPA: permease [Pyrinomonadaceae bacterium]|nr:permease [Pyrinomonadaceae bacterium]
MTAEQRDNIQSLTTIQRIVGFALPTLLIIGALIAYKSSAALAVIGKVSATGVFTPRASVIPLVGTSEASVITRTLNYFLIIWPALFFGVLISGAVTTFVPSRWLVRALGKGSLRAQIIAGATGAPLMLCSCCVAPIFKGVYERSARLGPSLGLMLAAPALNPAALILTFMLFDYRVAGARAAASLAAVLFTGMIADKIFGQTRVACEVDYVSQDLSARSQLLRFVRSCVQVALRLIPVIVIGVLASMVIAQWLPASAVTSPNAKLLTVIGVATFAVPLALPTFFEIPLAFVLLSSGAPVGAALALLIAGPAVNLPSLLTIMRSTSWKVAAVVAASVWAISVASGILVNMS